MPPPEAGPEPEPDEDGARVASHLVAAFEAGVFKRMETFLTPDCTLLRRGDLARVPAACPHAPLLPGPEEEEVGAMMRPAGVGEKEEEEGEPETASCSGGSEAAAAAAAATLKATYFRVENKASLGEVTAWLRRGLLGRARGLSALTRLEVRCDELGDFVGGSPVPATTRLVGAALTLPKLELLVLAWRPAGPHSADAESRTPARLWNVILKAPPVPKGYHLEAVFSHMRNRRGWWNGFLGPRQPGRRPAVMEEMPPDDGAERPHEIPPSRRSTFYIENLHSMGFQRVPPAPHEHHLARFAEGDEVQGKGWVIFQVDDESRVKWWKRSKIPLARVV